MVTFLLVVAAILGFIAFVVAGLWLGANGAVCLEDGALREAAVWFTGAALVVSVGLAAPITYFTLVADPSEHCGTGTVYREVQDDWWCEAR